MDKCTGITTNYFARNPYTLFFLDGLGAILTANSLVLILRNYYQYVGMPVNILAYLSAIGLIFCEYSMFCYFLIKKNWIPYLRFISKGNFSYCVLITVLLFYYSSQLVQLGLTYFL